MTHGQDESGREWYRGTWEELASMPEIMRDNHILKISTSYPAPPTAERVEEMRRQGLLPEHEAVPE